MSETKYMIHRIPTPTIYANSGCSPILYSSVAQVKKPRKKFIIRVIAYSLYTVLEIVTVKLYTDGELPREGIGTTPCPTIK
ncbi:hypothetical protein D3C81_877320 [compost metagenome]